MNLILSNIPNNIDIRFNLISLSKWGFYFRPVNKKILQVGTNHPLLKSAKNLLIGSKSNLQSVGLIILLASKAAGIDVRKYTRDHYDSGVLHAQRALAEIVEMKRTGHLIHKTMANLQEKEKHGKKYKDLLYGNKIVLLTG